MERDKIVARERAQSLWRFMQLIEASRHRADRLEAWAPRSPEIMRAVLTSAAEQLRVCADELHALSLAADPGAVRLRGTETPPVANVDNAKARHFG